MSGKNHATKRAETTAVVRALQAAGIMGHVKHGRGTDSMWLEVNIGSGQQWGEHQRADKFESCDLDCRRCCNLRAMERATEAIVSDVTGRTGERARVSVLTQDRFDRKLGRSVPIEHPDWKEVLS